MFITLVKSSVNRYQPELMKLPENEATGDMAGVRLIALTKHTAQDQNGLSGH